MSHTGKVPLLRRQRGSARRARRFGGDPQNVTVTDHSAGAYTTIALLAEPAADGLHRRLATFSDGASRIVPAWWAEELPITFLTCRRP
jgi:para-nitrobenzyl esterase